MSSELIEIEESPLGYQNDMMFEERNKLEIGNHQDTDSVTSDVESPEFQSPFGGDKSYQLSPIKIGKTNHLMSAPMDYELDSPLEKGSQGYYKFIHGSQAVFNLEKISEKSNDDEERKPRPSQSVVTYKSNRSNRSRKSRKQVIRENWSNRFN